MNHPIAGVHYFIDGFKLITSAKLRRFVIIPAIINIAIFIGLFFLLQHFMQEFNRWFIHLLPSWLQWLSYILWIIFFISFFIIFIYTFVTFANIISAPFNSFLAEKVELHLTGIQLNSRSLWENIKDTPRIIGRQFAIIGYYLPRAIGILLLFLIPFTQPIAALIWFAFNAWYLSLTYLDYPTDNHQIPLSQVRHWQEARRYTALGFGASVLIASMIPFLNFFTVPAAVAGATKFWIEQQK